MTHLQIGIFLRIVLIVRTEGDEENANILGSFKPFLSVTLAKTFKAYASLVALFRCAAGSKKIPYHFLS